MAGFRGAVSLAAALAIPETLASGAPFPDRDVIIFVVSGVIVVTLALQGLLLPAVVRWARLPADTAFNEERRLAQRLATEEALAAMPEVAARLGVDDSVLQRLHAEYDDHMRVLQLDDGGDLDEDEMDADHRAEAQYKALRLEVLAHKRATVVRLRDEQRIDDTVLRQLQAKLDIEELRLSRRQIVD
jgi:CPA1 family monovalent cation:H+ antiporter